MSVFKERHAGGVKTKAKYLQTAWLSWSYDNHASDFCSLFCLDSEICLEIYTTIFTPPFLTSTNSDSKKKKKQWSVTSIQDSSMNAANECCIEFTVHHVFA